MFSQEQRQILQQFNEHCVQSLCDALFNRWFVRYLDAGGDELKHQMHALYELQDLIKSEAHINE